MPHLIAGWSSPVARQAHNLKVVGSNPAPATNIVLDNIKLSRTSFYAIFNVFTRGNIGASFFIKNPI